MHVQCYLQQSFNFGHMFGVDDYSASYKNDLS